MELGALGLHGREPAVRGLPGRATCARGGRAGYPAYDGPPRRGQTYAGTDRQCRGRLLGGAAGQPTGR